MNNNRNEIFSDEKVIEKELKKPERNRVKIDAMAEVMVLMAGFWR